MIFSSDVYSKGGYPMPDRDSKRIRSKEKDSSEYNLAMARAVYAAFCGGRTFGGYDLYNQIDLLRSYAYGNQDQEKYKDAFYGKSKDGVISPLGKDEDKSLKRKAFASLNFDIMSPMPRVIDALIARISKATDMVSIDAVDQYSTDLKEDMKWGAYVEGKFKDLFRTLNAIGGLPSEEPGYVPRNVEELNLYEAEGGFRQAYVETMEELVKYTFDTIGRWEENIQDRVIFDLIVNGFACVEDVCDEFTGEVRPEYRDAKFCGVQYTRQDGYHKPDYGFAVSMVKMSDLRQKGFSEEQLKGLAKKFADQYGNPAADDWSDANKVGSLYSRGYDDFLAPVLKVYWIDVDHVKEIEYTNKYGAKRTYSYEEGKSLGKREKMLETRIKFLRQASWVIDTELIYDFGKVKNQARDGMAHPVIPIHMVKVLGRPVLPRLIPALDLYQNSWMKFQQGIRMATLNGFSIEMGAISNLSLGNKKLNPTDVIKMWRETGILFRKDSDYAGRMNVASRAIEPLAGGAGAILKEALDGMQIAMNLVEEITGVNPITLGQTPSSDQGKGLTEYAMGSTDLILGQIVKPVNILKADVARNICLRIQQAVREKPRSKKLYGAVIGETRLELIRQAEGHDVRYGIRTVVRPTDEEKQFLIELITTSLKNGRDGKVGITEADAIRFFSMIKAGHSLKRVGLLLDFANQKAQEEAEARAARASQMEAQQNEQYLMLKAQAEEQAIQSKARIEMLVEGAKARNEALLKAYERGDISFDDL